MVIWIDFIAIVSLIVAIKCYWLKDEGVVQIQFFGAINNYIQTTNYQSW